MAIGTKISVTRRDLLPDQTREKRVPSGRGLFGEMRNLMLVWSGILIAGFIGLSVPIAAGLVLHRADVRVRQDLVEELDSFDRYIAERTASSNAATPADLKKIFQEFLALQAPENDTFLIAFLDGRFYRSNSIVRPESLQENTALMQRWAKLTKEERGEWQTSDPELGTIVYLATPIAIDGKVHGVFAIANATAGEIRQTTDVIFIVARVLLIGLVLTLILAWITAEKVLEPLRMLAATARSLSESNLDRRIPVQTSGEIGELAAAFNRTIDRARDAAIAKTAFIDDAGRELQTPIAIVRGHLERLDDEPQARQETLALVLDELDRMKRMADDLVLLAALERPNCLQLETIDLALLTRELYSKATASADRNWKLDTDAIGVIVCDRQRLMQAAMNLIEYAIQYGTETDEIAIGTAIEDDFVRFWVRSTGRGIADCDRIFERFARGNNRSGLALPIARAIAEAHGGRVELVSKLGVGSTFTLILPLKLLQGQDL